MVTLRSFILLSIIFPCIVRSQSFPLANFTKPLPKWKPLEIHVLALMWYTGSEPRDGALCTSAMQVPIDVVNNRSDFLPQYHVVPHFIDEGLNGNFGLREISKFLQNSKNPAKPYLPSPVIVGPYFTAGCLRTAAAMHQFDTLGFSMGCTASTMSNNRRIYPNLFHVRAQADVVLFSKYHFVKEIGRWNTVAMLSSAGSVRDVYGAVDLQNLFVNNGVRVPWFNFVLNIDSTVIESIKESNLRVILLEITTLGVALQFFCLSFMGGLTGPRYVFIAPSIVMIDPYQRIPNLLQGCNREMLVAQQRSTYYVTHYMFAHQNHGKTSLGYDRVEFELLLEQKAGKDRMVSQDALMKDLCHDNMMQVLLTLNETQDKLSQRNMSLSDFQNNPREVMLVANETASTLEPVTVRYGKQKWSRRLETDDEPQSVFIWSEKERRIKYLFLIQHDPARDYFDPDSYSFRQVTETIPWNGPGGKPPIAFPPLVVSNVESPRALVTFMQCSAAAVSLVQIVGIFFLVCRKPQFLRIFNFSRLAILLGCLALNVSCFVFIESSQSAASCSLIYATCLLGLGLLNVATLLRIFSFLSSWAVMKQVSNQTKIGNTLRASTVRPRTTVFATNAQLSLANLCETEYEDRNPSQGGYFMIVVLALTSLSIIVAWLIVDPPSTIIKSMTGGAVYNFEKDVHEDILITQCETKLFSVWFSVGCAIQIISSVIAILALLSKRSYAFAGSRLKPFVACQINMASLIAAAIMLNLVMSNNSNAQSVVNAVISLLLSIFSYVVTNGREILTFTAFNSNTEQLNAVHPAATLLRSVGNGNQRRPTVLSVVHHVPENNTAETHGSALNN